MVDGLSTGGQYFNGVTVPLGAIGKLYGIDFVFAGAKKIC